MLISCKSLAGQLISESDFAVFLKRVEILTNIDSKAALTKLNTYQNDLSSYSLNSQINFYRIQSEAYSEQGVYSLSNSAADLGLTLAKQMTNPSIYIAELAYTKGFAIESLGDFDGAIEFYQHGLDVSRSMNNQEFIAKGLINIGAIYYLRKNYKQSLITLNSALKIASNVNNEELMGDITSELGILYGYLGAESQANNYFQISYQHYKNAGKHNYALNSLHNVAINHSNQKRYEEAIKVYRTLEKEIRVNTTNEFISGIYRNLAWALINKEDPDLDNGYRYIMLAGEYVKEIEQHQFKHQYMIDKAFALTEMERFQEALNTVEQAQILVKEKSTNIYKQNEMEIMFLTAKLNFALGRFALANEAQKKYFIKLIALNRTKEISEIDELRLKYESDRETLKKNILEKKQTLQIFQLQKMELETRNRELLFTGLAFLILILAWWLYRTVKREKHVLNDNDANNISGHHQVIPLAKRYFAESQLKEQAYSICIIEFDEVIQIQDELGIKLTAELMKKIVASSDVHMRESDVFSIFSQHSFLILLPNTARNQAIVIMERLKNHLESNLWPVGTPRKLHFYVGGASYLNRNYDSFDVLLKAAQSQIDTAKKSMSLGVVFDA